MVSNSESASSSLGIHVYQDHSGRRHKRPAPNTPNTPHTCYTPLSSVAGNFSFNMVCMFPRLQSLAKRLSGCSVSSRTGTVHSLTSKNNCGPHTLPSYIEPWRVIHSPPIPLFLSTAKCGICSELAIIRYGPKQRQHDDTPHGIAMNNVDKRIVLHLILLRDCQVLSPEQSAYSY
jgi:hypothetical protein